MSINGGWSRFQARFRQAYLLGCLLVLIVARPFMDKHGVGIIALEVLQYVLLLVAASAAVTNKRRACIIGGLLVVSILGRAFYDSNGSTLALYVYLGCWMAFYLAVAMALLTSLFSSSAAVTSETLCAACSVYLILGIVWALAYAMLEISMPGSFTPSFPLIGNGASYERFLGFSYTTLTTLGYGNIAPATPQADSLTSAEAIVGQLYVAIVMARLVAMQLISREEARDR